MKNSPVATRSPPQPEALRTACCNWPVRGLPKHTREVVLDLDAMGHLLACKKAATSTPITTTLVICRSTWSVAMCCCGRNCAPPSTARPRACGRTAKDRAGGSEALPEGADPGPGDSGFEGEELMAWCESQPHVYYCLGLSKNSRLLDRLDATLAEARAAQCRAGAACGGLPNLPIRPSTSWSRSGG